MLIAATRPIIIISASAARPSQGLPSAPQDRHRSRSEVCVARARRRGCCGQRCERDPWELAQGGAPPV